MNKFLATTILVLLVSTLALAQGRGGARVYTGLTSATSKDALLTPEGTSITGYHVGLDARLFSGTMFFGGGIQYHKLTLLAQTEEDFFSPDNSLSVIKTRFGLGFNAHQFTHLIMLRAKVFGTFDFNSDYDRDLIPNNEDYVYTGAYAGLVFGLGLDIGFITFDVEYEKGLVNALEKRPDSKLDYWTASVGFFF